MPSPLVGLTGLINKLFTILFSSQVRGAMQKFLSSGKPVQAFMPIKAYSQRHRCSSVSFCVPSTPNLTSECGDARRALPLRRSSASTMSQLLKRSNKKVRQNFGFVDHSNRPLRGSHVDCGFATWLSPRSRSRRVHEYPFFSNRAFLSRLHGKESYATSAPGLIHVAVTGGALCLQEVTET